MKVTPLLDRLPRFIQKRKEKGKSRCGLRMAAVCRTRGGEEVTRAPGEGNADRSVAALCEGQTADYLSCLFLQPLQLRLHLCCIRTRHEIRRNAMNI